MKIADLKCLTNILLQAQAGSGGTVVLIEKDKSVLEQNNIPANGLRIDPANNIYSFCWKGELWARAAGGQMFLDVVLGE